MNLRILFVEDSPNDMELMLRRLRQAGIEPQWERVQSEAALREALVGEQWQVALVDYNLPGFGGLQALALLAEQAPDLPAITVSGAITEETAVATITAGAVDYVLKDNLTRLAPAVRRAAEGAQLRREQRRAAEQARRTQFAIDHSSQAIAYVSEDGTILYSNESAQRLGTVDPEGIVGQKIWGWSPLVDERVWAELWQAASRGPVINFESTIRLPNGAERLISATLDFQQGGEDRFVIVYVRDITEQREAEQRAATSEARYAAVFEKNRAIKLVVDPLTAAIVDANPAACEFYGYSHEELLALKITDINAASEADVAEALARTASELVTRFVASHRLASGELRDVEVNSGPFEVGGRTLLFSIVQDVTDRSRAEEALHRSEAMYRRIVDLAGEGIWGMDGEYRTTFVNPQIAAMLGYESHEMLGHVVTEFMFEEDVADHGARMRERRRGVAGHYQRRFRRKDGGEVWTAVSATPEIGPEGEFFGSFGMFADVTEQKRYEEALQRSEAHLHTLIDTLPDLVWLKDSEGVYLSCNRRFEAFFGAPQADIIGKTDYDFAQAELADALRRHDKAAMTAGGPTVNEEEIAFAEDGHSEVLETIKTAVYASDGRLIGILGVGRDITERERAQDALLQSEDRFRRVSEVTSDFAYSCVSPVGGRFRFDWLTGAVERMTGWTREELLEWGCWKRLVIDEDVPLFERQVTGLAPGASSACELRIRDRQGRVRWLMAHSEVEASVENPTVHHLHGACQDITERKLAEAELVRSHDLLLYLARLVPGVIYQYRLYPDGRSAFPYASPGINDIYEVTPEEVREDATAVFGRLHPDDHERVAEAIQESALTLDEFRCEFRVVLPRQGLRWRWSQAHPQRTEDGGTLWHGIISDITERKVAEDALRESEERFESFAEHLPGYLFMQDEQRRYVYANRQDEMDGLVRRGDWLGKTPSQVWAGDNAVRAEVRVQRALDGEVVDIVERWEQPGVNEYLHTIYFPVPRQGKAPMAGGISLDVTEQMEAQEVVRRQAEQLRRTVEGAVLAMSLVVETRDPYTAGHERRVSELATAIAGEVGVEGEDLAALRLAGLIHDIGKIAVPSEILSKPGRLSQIELDLIKQHPASGYDILDAIDFGLPVAEIVLQHHERLDGSGYPRALTGENILPGARILAVADVVEAMSSHRPYRPALGIAAALAEVKEHAGDKYDADAVAACVGLFEEQGFQFST